MRRLLAIGLVAGFFSAVFGVGGGILIVPLLVLVAGFGERIAMGTSLGAIGLTALAGVAGYSLLGRIHLLEAVVVGLPAAAGAVGGAALQQRLRRRTLTLLFSGLLVVVALTLLFA